MRLGNMDIELEGVEAVEKYIRRNRYLKPYFQRNDKSPIFDGEVFVYKDDNKHKPNTSLLGCVKVQIKGIKKSKKEESLNILSYSVKVNDLQVFLKDGGAIFFVSEIYDDFDSRVFYCILLPIDINAILKDKMNQETVTLKLSRLPAEEIEVADIFLNFIYDKIAQLSTADKEKVNMQDWLNSGHKLNDISISYSSFDKNIVNPFQLMTKHSMYVYQNIDQFNIKIPIDKAEKLIVNYNDLDKIESKTFIYDKVSTKWEDGNANYSFGKTLILHLSTTSIELVTKLNGSLNEVIRDLSFLIEIIEYRYFKINQNTVSINDLDVSYVNSVRNLFDQYTAIKSALDFLGVDDDLNIQDVVESELWKIDLLINISKRGASQFISNVESRLISLNIANLRILLIEQNIDGRKQYINYFKPELCFYYSINDEEDKFQVSRYVYLNTNNLLLSNFKLELVFDDIVKFSTSNNYRYKELIVLFLLELIKTYDINRDENIRFIYLADKLSDWLLTYELNTINKINKYQVIKRMKYLTDDQKDDCNKILIVSTGAEKISVLILLEKYDDAILELEKLNQVDRNTFMDYPIYNLLKSNSHQDAFS